MDPHPRSRGSTKCIVTMGSLLPFPSVGPPALSKRSTIWLAGRVCMLRGNMREELARLLDGLTGRVQFCDADPRYGGCLPRCVMNSKKSGITPTKCSECLFCKRCRQSCGGVGCGRAAASVQSNVTREVTGDKNGGLVCRRPVSFNCHYAPHARCARTARKRVEL